MLQAHKAAVDRFVAEARGCACSARAAWLIEGRERDSIQGFLVSVKSGKPSVLHVKELIATLEDQGGALGLLIELDKERGSGLEVVDNDEDVVHPPDRHLLAPRCGFTAASAWRRAAPRSQPRRPSSA
jgi:hypothetical protein